MASREMKEMTIMVALSLVIIALLSLFAWRELFPEYKEYQKSYVALEQARAELLGDVPPPFKWGIKQIVMQDAPGRAPRIDRCTSCHVALELPHFSPTRLKRDLNGYLIRDPSGHFMQEENPDYLFKRLDQEREEIARRLEGESPQSALAAQLAQRLEELEQLEVVKIQGKEVDLRKMMRTHPLFPTEERPFEHHNVQEYGCTVCHSGNGRALTTKRAHGPALDGTYKTHEHGKTVQFQESDGINDPIISKMYNAKPGHELLFQTTPIYLGGVVQASCAQCHATMQEKEQEFLQLESLRQNEFEQELLRVQQEIERQKKALISLLNIHFHLRLLGPERLLESLEQAADALKITSTERKERLEQIVFWKRISKEVEEELATASRIVPDATASPALLLEDQGSKKPQMLKKELLLKRIASEAAQLIGEKSLQRLLTQIDRDARAIEEVVEAFFEQSGRIQPRELKRIPTSMVQSSSSSQASLISPFALLSEAPARIASAEGGLLDAWIERARALREQRRQRENQGEAAQTPSEVNPHINPHVNQGKEHQQQGRFTSSANFVDDMMLHYTRGRELFVSQACYACHAITLYSRGAVGPELTQIGKNYPWYVKESIVWPQADLASSSMPNFKLDHEDLEDLMAFLMAQKGEKPQKSSTQYAKEQARWSSGKLLMPWEKPLNRAEKSDLSLGYEIFATQGCAACHRLQGYESSSALLPQGERWFEENFSTRLSGRELVETLILEGEELERRSTRTAPPGMLEQLLEKDPQFWELIASYVGPYKFARRAIMGEGFEMALEERKVLLERLDHYLKLYISHYGLGREVAPLLNYSGVYRSKEWLYGHFLRPSDYVAKSIMPAFPFDPSKFALLTEFLQVLGEKNRQKRRAQIDAEGFDPQRFYLQSCASCHGTSRLGNGPVSAWIYPIPKNLRNTTFMRGLTREQAIASIVYGVPGTPMAAWNAAPSGGEPVLKVEEIAQIVDWLLEQLPSAERFSPENSVQEVPKWEYQAPQVVEELSEDRDFMRFLKEQQHEQQQELPKDASSTQERYSTAELKKHVPFSSCKQSGLGALCLLLFPSILVASATAPLSQEFSQESSQVFAREKKEPKRTQESVDQVFEQRPQGSYIKDLFYTEENLNKGKTLYIEHCAHCHGRQGAGDGLRSVTMKEAKPRVLIHLPWIEKRDDLRLLRAIKYGVPGTSMISFADVTTAWQRLQLVAYVRSLTRERYDLEQALARIVSKAQAIEEVMESTLRARQGTDEARLLEELRRQQRALKLLYEQYLRGGDFEQGGILPRELEEGFALQVKEGGKEGTSRGAPLLLRSEEALTALKQALERVDQEFQGALVALAKEEKQLLGQIRSSQRAARYELLLQERERLSTVRQRAGELYAAARELIEEIESTYPSTWQ